MYIRRFFFALAFILTPFFLLSALFAADFPNEETKRAMLDQAQERGKLIPPPSPLAAAHQGALGIRKIAVKYIDFYTDLPSTPETDAIPAALSAAVPKLAEYFDIPISRYENWHIEAFLMSNREPFEIFGALEGAPEFPNGYSLDRRIWVFDKHQGYYNRFLLLHELVHALTNETFGALEPRWFSEGIAEYLALHRWDGENLELGIFPDSPDEVAGFGRIDRIREAVRSGKVPPSKEIFDYQFNDYEQVTTYAWSWALVTMFASSERYRGVLAAMPYLMTDPEPNRRFLKLLGEEARFLPNDWFDFAARLDYGNHGTLPPIDYTPGLPLEKPETVRIEVGAGCWINSRIELEAGKNYRLTASGRYQVKDPRRLLPCEPYGITLRYVDGRPLGQLLAGVPYALPGGGWSITPVASKAEIVPEHDGPLLFRINVPLSDIHDAKGSVTVKIEKK